MLRSDLCGYSDAYIVVKGTTDFLADDANENLKLKKMLRLKIMLHLDHAFQKLIIENAENLDIVMQMYNLLEYSQNYSMTSGSLWNIIGTKLMMLMIMLLMLLKSFIYKIKIVGNTPERPRNEGDANHPPVSILNVEVTIPLTCFSNVWRSLNLPLINCDRTKY